MELLTNLLWTAGDALSLGFLAYGAVLLLFARQPRQTRATPALRLHLAS